MSPLAITTDFKVIY